MDRKHKRDIESMQTLADLYQSVALALCGKDVILRWNQIPFKGKYGVAHKADSGKMIIDMRADLDPETSLKVFLHECAHVKLHYSQFQKTSLNSVIPFSLEDVKINKDSKLEDEAETLKKHWLSWARLRMDPGGSKEESILKALLHYYK